MHILEAILKEVEVTLLELPFSLIEAVDLEGEGVLLLLVEKEGNSCEPIDVIDGDRRNTEEEMETEGVG